MINPAEHVYSDDPHVGHPDVRTRLPGVSYFLLGNGHIQAAVQWAPGGEGTPVGLLVMDPERLGKKREALTFDAERGLDRTVVRVVADGEERRPTLDRLRVRWTTHAGVPAVEAVWGWTGAEVREVFFCPDRTTSRLAREVSVSGPALRERPIRLRLGSQHGVVESLLSPPSSSACFLYTLAPARDHVEVGLAPGVDVSDDARTRWEGRSHFTFGDDRLDRLCRVSQRQLAGILSASGRMDASLWQYNREWVRDQAFVAIGFLMAGDRESAASILRRLLLEFVTAEGGTMDSSEVRTRDEAELDQNGVLLYALEHYVRWTGDMTLANDAWDLIAAVAEYPLRPEFADPGSGLLCNTREFWERHRVHGVQPGFELAHQVLVSIGLGAAAALARRGGRSAQAERWSAASERLRSATLTHPTSALVSDGVLIKRKNLDGSVQDLVDALPDSLMPPQAPLVGPGPHRLNPDTCTALPIAMGFVAPDSPLARRTLDRLDALWNQAWNDGGYGRYNVTSEPDSPGGWPFASLFVARAAVEAGVPDRAWRVLKWLDSVAGATAGSWFEYYGERVSPPFPQVGIVPWTWSEMLALLVQHVMGIRPEERHLRIRPRLLPGLEHATADFRFGTGRVELRLARDRQRKTPLARVHVDGGSTGDIVADEVVVPAGANDVVVELVVPGN